jgi:hypothetical protein
MTPLHQNMLVIITTSGTAAKIGEIIQLESAEFFPDGGRTVLAKPKGMSKSIL